MKKLVSFLWSAATAFNRQLYQRRFFKKIKAAACVVSIGNFIAGGTGKTPLIVFLARYLMAKKGPLAVLVRGYRSAAERQHKQIVLPPEKVAAWQEIGDEPALLRRLLPAAWLRLKDAGGLPPINVG